MRKFLLLSALFVCFGFTSLAQCALTTSSILGSNSVCANTNGVTYSVTNNTRSTYAWTITGGTPVASSTTNAITVNWGVAGSGNLQVIETFSGGCVGNAVNLAVNIKPRPIAYPITGSPTPCVGQASYSIPATLGSTYVWNIIPTTPAGPSQTLPTTTNNATVNWTIVGTDVINVTETNSSSCTGPTSSLLVNVQPPLVINAPSTQLCPGNTMALSPTSGGTWSSSNPSVATVSSVGVVTAVANGSTNLTFAQPSGCSSSKVITVGPNPNLSISGTSTVCPNSTNVTYTCSNTTGSTFAWTITGGSKVSGGNTNTITVNWGPSGPGNVSVTETNPSLSCPGTPVNFPVNIISVSPITGSSSVCTSSTTYYSVPPTSGATYTWTVTGGALVSGASTNVIGVTWGPAGSGNVSVVANGCLIPSSNLPVIINSIPVTSVISGKSTVCSGASGVSYSVVNTPGSTYSWTITNTGGASGTQASGGNSNSITVNWSTVIGSAKVSVVETTAAGCVGAQVDFPVNIVYPSTSLITGSNTVYANAQPATYSVTNTVGSTYLWTITGGTQVSGGNSNSITVLWTAPGSGSVKVVETNSAGCLGSPVTLSVLINAAQCTPPTTSAITGSTSGCIQPGYNSYYVTGNLGSTYVWTVTGGAPYIAYSCNSGTWGGTTTCYTNVAGTPISSSGVLVNWTSPGTGTISVFETNSSGCVGAPVSLQVSVSALPTVSAPAARMCAGSTMQLSPSTGGTWSSSSPSTATVTSSGGVTAVASGSVTFTFVASSGCSKSITIDVGPPLPSQINSCTPTTVCQNQIFTYYTGGGPCYPGTTLGSTYTWTVTGGTIVNGNGTSTVNVKWITPGSGNLSVVETAYGGCSGPVANFPVTINPVPSSTITGGTNICTPSSGMTYSVPFNSGDTYAWTISGGTIVSGANTNSITVNWNAGVGSVTGNVSVVETTSNGCTGTSNLNVSISNPSVNQILGSGTVCTNTSSSYYVQYYYSSSGGHSGADSRSRYDWTITGGTLTSGANTDYIIVNWGPAGTGSISVVETTYSGCQEPAITIPVVINGPATSPITGNPSVCTNTNGVAYSVINTTGSTYAWTITGGTVASGAGTNTITVNWGVAGLGNVKVVETNSTSCIGVAVNLPVTINAIPITSSISGTAPVCPNSSNVVYSVTGTAGSTYAWTITGGTPVASSTSNTIKVNWGAAGTGTVKVVETSAAGCVGAAVTKTVTINANPTTSAITGSATACPNATGMIYGVTNTTGSTYNWTIAGGTKTSGGTTNSITVTWGTGGAGNVSVIETNGTGCIGTTISKAVTVSPLTSAIAGNVTVCPNSNGVAYSVANVTGDTYTWTATGGTVVCGQNTSTILVNWGAAGPGTLSVTERNATCTGVPVSLPVAITPSPATSAITGNAAVCAYSTGIQYSVTNTTGSTYAWTVSGGTIVSGNNTNTVTVNWGAIGTGNISVVETSGTGCIGTAVNKIVSITSVSTGIITGSSSMCLPANGIIYSVLNTVGSTYTWTVNGGNVVSGAGTNSITVNWTLAGPGLVSVVETNSAGCVGNVVAQPIQVNAKPATSTITGNNSVCANATGVSYSVANTGSSTYVWTITGGTPATPSTTNSITVNWGATGTGNVSVVETNNSGCVGLPVNLPVTINALPVITVSPASATISSGGSVNLTASGASAFSWSPATGLSATTGATVSAHPTVTTTYTVTGTTNGCSGTKPVTVTVGCTPPAVSISYPYGLNVCTGIVLTASAGSSYLWSTGETTQSIYPDIAGGYTVTVYNALGCSASASVTTTRSPLNCAIARVAAGSQPAKSIESEDEPKGHKISVHPNPANHEVIVETPKRAEQDTQVVLYDMMGRVSGSGILKKGEWQVTISTSEVANGMYVVRIGTGDQANSEKVIIEHK